MGQPSYDDDNRDYDDDVAQERGCHHEKGTEPCSVRRPASGLSTLPNPRPRRRRDPPPRNVRVPGHGVAATRPLGNAASVSRSPAQVEAVYLNGIPFAIAFVMAVAGCCGCCCCIPKEADSALATNGGDA